MFAPRLAATEAATTATASSSDDGSRTASDTIRASSEAGPPMKQTGGRSMLLIGVDHTVDAGRVIAGHGTEHDRRDDRLARHPQPARQRHIHAEIGDRQAGPPSMRWRTRTHPARAGRPAACRRAPGPAPSGRGRHRRSGQGGGGPSRWRRVPPRHRGRPQPMRHRPHGAPGRPRRPWRARTVGRRTPRRGSAPGGRCRGPWRPPRRPRCGAVAAIGGWGWAIVATGVGRERAPGQCRQVEAGGRDPFGGLARSPAVALDQRAHGSEPLDGGVVVEPIAGGRPGRRHDAVAALPCPDRRDAQSRPGGSLLDRVHGLSSISDRVRLTNTLHNA